MAAAAAPLTTPRAAGQLPYADAFRLCRIDTWPRGDFAHSGDVRWEVDRGVGRPVVRLAGAVPGANSLALPASRSGCLSLTGRFLYIQASRRSGMLWSCWENGLHFNPLHEQLRCAAPSPPRRALHARCYLQMQLAVGKTYAIHIEFATADKNVQRLTISNLCKQDKTRVGQGLAGRGGTR